MISSPLTRPCLGSLQGVAIAVALTMLATMAGVSSP
jgi:hypothetical protein